MLLKVWALAHKVTENLMQHVMVHFNLSGMMVSTSRGVRSHRHHFLNVRSHSVRTRVCCSSVTCSCLGAFHSCKQSSKHCAISTGYKMERYCSVRVVEPFVMAVCQQLYGSFRNSSSKVFPACVNHANQGLGIITCTLHFCSLHGGKQPRINA